MRLDEGALVHCNDIDSEWRNVPTCTGSLILNQQVLSFLTSGLLQLALVAVVFPIGTTNLQKERHKAESEAASSLTPQLFLLYLASVNTRPRVFTEACPVFKVKAHSPRRWTKEPLSG